ncbi:unnamed protein product [Echinostoma caproni]|uniref:Trafficking protein particle complex subunit 9 n=1 Tax=Echinostoma caproni TaxID=27848 RepID=A0A183A2G7_9TREM|nr:unnamed protein product [Echinostoma caproni]
MDAFRLLYASHVRPRLEYGCAVTYPCTAGELAKLERVQRAASRLVVVLRGPAMKVAYKLLVCSQLRIGASEEISSV